MSDTYTKEQIDKAKERLSAAATIEASWVTKGTTCFCTTRGDVRSDVKALLSALSTAEQERDKWETLAEETEIERERIAARAGEAESRIKELEAAGNKMRHSCILREACDEWDALID